MQAANKSIASAAATNLNYQSVIQRIFRWNVFRHKGPSRNAPESARSELNLNSMASLTQEFDNP